LRGELHERLADAELVGDERLAGLRLASGEVADDFRALLGSAAKRISERNGVVRDAGRSLGRGAGVGSCGHDDGSLMRSRLLGRCNYPTGGANRIAPAAPVRRSTLPTCQRKLRCAIASPIAK